MDGDRRPTDRPGKGTERPNGTEKEINDNTMANNGATNDDGATVAHDNCVLRRYESGPLVRSIPSERSVRSAVVHSFERSTPDRASEHTSGGGT